MQGKTKRPRLESILASLVGSPLHLELEKSGAGAVAVVAGIVSIAEYSEQSVTLMSHKGRVILCGKYLTITVLENKTVEVCGRIEEVRFTYGRS